MQRRTKPWRCVLHDDKNSVTTVRNMSDVCVCVCIKQACCRVCISNHTLTMAVSDNRPVHSTQLQTYRNSWKERPAHMEQRLITIRH